MSLLWSFIFLKDPEPYGSAFINKKKRIDIVEFHVFCFLMMEFMMKQVVSKIPFGIAYAQAALQESYNVRYYRSLQSL